jgi:hypothetical protein
MTRQIDYSRLPGHMRDGWRRYIERGIPGGSFLMAVVSNDLMGAMRNADEVNIEMIFQTCSFLHNEAPCGCFGSPERAEEWIADGGLSGMDAA